MLESIELDASDSVNTRLHKTLFRGWGGELDEKRIKLCTTSELVWLLDLTYDAFKSRKIDRYGERYFHGESRNSWSESYPCLPHPRHRRKYLSGGICLKIREKIVQELMARAAGLSDRSVDSTEAEQKVQTDALNLLIHQILFVNTWKRNHKIFSGFPIMIGTGSFAKYLYLAASACLAWAKEIRGHGGLNPPVLSMTQGSMLNILPYPLVPMRDTEIMYRGGEGYYRYSWRRRRRLAPSNDNSLYFKTLKENWKWLQSFVGEKQQNLSKAKGETFYDAVEKEREKRAAFKHKMPNAAKRDAGRWTNFIHRWGRLTDSDDSD